jgi:ribonuclease VapC
VSDGVEVLDASALLAWLQEEPGAEAVRLEGAVMNSVNWSEVLQKAVQRGVAVAGLREELAALGLKLQAFSLEEGERAADLYPQTKALGLSLADRACLATALLEGGVAVTSDQAWSKLKGMPVRQLR